MSVNHVRNMIKALLDEPDASFEIEMILLNNSVVKVIVTRLEKDTYLVTIWQGRKHISRHIPRHMVFNYLDQLVSNFKSKKVFVIDLRRAWY